MHWGYPKSSSVDHPAHSSPLHTRKLRLVYAATTKARVITLGQFLLAIAIANANKFAVFHLHIQT